MKSIGYHAFTDTRSKVDGLNTCESKSDKYPLLVNCTGVFSENRKFTSDNPEGRLDYYLMYVITGRVDVHFPDAIKECGEGSLIVFPPNTRYTYTHSEDGILEYVFIHFTGSAVEEVLADCGILIHPEINYAKCSDTLIARFQNMFDAFAKQDKLRDRDIGAILEQILVSLGRRILDKREENKKKLHKSLGKILSEYSGQISVAKLAELEGLSISRYNTVFREQFGLSPVKYLTETRMSVARDLLKTTDMNVNQIGRMCGYNDSHFFSKMFKSLYGVSPSEYRAGKRKDGEV